MAMKNHISFTEMRKVLRKNGVSEKVFYRRLVKLDNGTSPTELLKLITNHLYHSEEEELYAPPHLRSLQPLKQCPE